MSEFWLWESTPEGLRGALFHAYSEAGAYDIGLVLMWRQMYPQQQDAYAGQQPVYQQPQQAYQGYVV